MYTHIPILLLTEIPQPGKQGKRSPANRRVEPGATQIYCRLRPVFEISKSDELQPIRLYT